MGTCGVVYAKVPVGGATALDAAVKAARAVSKHSSPLGVLALDPAQHAFARSPRKPMCPPSRHVTNVHAAAPDASEPSSQARLRPNPDPRAHLGASCRASARTPITLTAPGRAQSSGAGGSMK
jgi:hypothetical protein